MIRQQLPWRVPDAGVDEVIAVSIFCFVDMPTEAEHSTPQVTTHSHYDCKRALVSNIYAR